MLVGDSSLTYRVIGLAMKTHTELGPGLDESMYHKFLFAKLTDAGILARYKPGGVLNHHGAKADEFEADIIVAQQVVLELKRLDEGFAPDHFLQLHCYQKFWSLPVGLLFDFGKDQLIYERRVLTEPNSATWDLPKYLDHIPSFVADRELAVTMGECLSRILAEHGFGYRDTTYRGLLRAEFVARRIPFRERPSVAIKSGGDIVGTDDLECFVVDERMAISVIALRNELRTADRAILQTYLKHLGLPWGLVVNFGKKRLETYFVVRPKTH